MLRLQSDHTPHVSHLHPRCLRVSLTLIPISVASFHSACHSSFRWVKLFKTKNDSNLSWFCVPGQAVCTCNTLQEAESYWIWSYLLQNLLRQRLRRSNISVIILIVSCTNMAWWHKRKEKNRKVEEHKGEKGEEDKGDQETEKRGERIKLHLIKSYC